GPARAHASLGERSGRRALRSRPARGRHRDTAPILFRGGAPGLLRDPLLSPADGVPRLCRRHQRLRADKQHKAPIATFVIVVCYRTPAPPLGPATPPGVPDGYGESTRNMQPMEFLGNLVLLIVGGNDTTRNSISGGVLALNQYPKEYDKLRKDLSLIPKMVPE